MRKELSMVYRIVALVLLLAGLALQMYFSDPDRRSRWTRRSRRFEENAAKDRAAAEAVLAGDDPPPWWDVVEDIAGSLRQGYSMALVPILFGLSMFFAAIDPGLTTWWAYAAIFALGVVLIVQAMLWCYRGGVVATQMAVRRQLSMSLPDPEDLR